MKVTVSELIAILRQQDPAAVVVLRGDVDYAAVALTCEELRRGAVQAVQLHKLPGLAGGWNPLGGAVLYELLNDDDVGAVQGVLLG